MQRPAPSQAAHLRLGARAWPLVRHAAGAAAPRLRVLGGSRRCCRPPAGPACRGSIAVEATGTWGGGLPAQGPATAGTQQDSSAARGQPSSWALDGDLLSGGGGSSSVDPNGGSSDSSGAWPGSPEWGEAAALGDWGDQQPATAAGPYAAAEEQPFSSSNGSSSPAAGFYGSAPGDSSNSSDAFRSGTAFNAASAFGNAPPGGAAGNPAAGWGSADATWAFADVAGAASQQQQQQQWAGTGGYQAPGGPAMAPSQPPSDITLIGRRDAVSTAAAAAAAASHASRVLHRWQQCLTLC